MTAGDGDWVSLRRTSSFALHTGVIDGYTGWSGDSDRWGCDVRRGNAANLSDDDLQMSRLVPTKATGVVRQLSVGTVVDSLFFEFALALT